MPKVLSFSVPLTLVLASFGACASGTGGAPDSAAQRQVTLDNDAVRVVESTYPVGAVTPMHSHPFPHVLYVIAGGTLQATGADGATETRDLKPGDTLWRNPGTHSTRNVGSTTVRILEVEIKGKSNGVAGHPGSAAE